MRLLPVLAALFSLSSPLRAEVVPAQVPAAAEISFVAPLVHSTVSQLTGLKLEEAQNRDGTRLFRSHAREYVRYRRNQIGAAAAGLSPQQCQDDQPLRSPFCAYVGDDWKMAVLRARYENESGDPSRPVPLSRGDYEQMVQSLRNSDLNDLEEVSEPVIRKLMKVFTQPDEVLKLADRILGESKCPPANILAAVGMKLEEFFPERKYMDGAIKLFTRVDQCTKTGDPSGARARYRLGLLHMLDGKCSVADPVFRRLAEFRGDDGMVSRALYWMGKCAKTEGHRLHADLFKIRILKWNPIGFHTTQLLEDHRQSQFSRFLLSSQPDVLLRSRAVPELNSVVRAIEGIQEAGSPHLAKDLLSFLKTRVVAAEPGFQFYAAILCDRSRDYIGKFQVLSRLFRQNSGLVSDETLRVFFPLRQFERVRRNHPSVDPLLLVSLIRQESGFNEQALSPVGAIGLMQLMPYTARRLGVRSRRSLFEPDVNVRAGIRYFESLVKRFGGDTDLALAGYNAGPERVDEWRRRYPTQDRMLFMDLIPFNETRNYVALIVRNYFWYQRLYGSSPSAATGQAALSAGARRSPARAMAPMKWRPARR